MDVLKIEEIEDILRKKQSKHRFRHTIGVQHTAICLAMRYGQDINKASLAGLLHDCAKQLEPEKLLQKCRRYHIPVSEVEEKSPYLLHGKVGAWMAEHKFGINDPDILSAITWHTTGRPQMTMLEAIVFVADYIEPGRNHAPNLDEIRQLAFEDLDVAVYRILAQTLSYLKKGSGNIDSMTECAGKYYKSIVCESNEIAK